jgi:hypothetical protein
VQIPLVVALKFREEMEAIHGEVVRGDLGLLNARYRNVGSGNRG